MRTVGSPIWFPLALLALAGPVAACEPDPHFTTHEPPAPGSILAEKSLVTTGSDQQLGLLYQEDIDNGKGGYQVRVSVPGNAYSVGTRVTVRLLSGLAANPNIYASLSFARGDGPITAMQILPTGRAPERPLRVEFFDVTPAYDNSLVLHALENDDVWSVDSRLNIAARPVSFDATRAGLWSLTQVPIWELREFKRVSLACDGRAMANPLPVLLDLSNGVYRATTLDAHGCRVARTAPTVLRDSDICFELAAEVCPQLTVSELKFAWKSGSSECGSAGIVTERYQLLPADSPDVLPPEPALCQRQEGGLPDGGRS